jgi:hypothetical protein
MANQKCRHNQLVGYGDKAIQQFPSLFIGPLQRRDEQNRVHLISATHGIIVALQCRRGCNGKQRQ